MMIFLLDRDETTLEKLAEVLLELGMELALFTAGDDALKAAEEREPDLILTSFLLQDRHAIDFLNTYRKKFPLRLNPILLLAAPEDIDVMVYALDHGVDDVISKNIHPEVLKAKINSLFRQQSKYFQPQFTSTFKELTLERVIDFCRRKAISGTLEIAGGGRSLTISLVEGTPTSRLDQNELNQLVTEEDAHFTILVVPISFEELKRTRKERTVRPTPPPKKKNLGLLSAITVNEKTIQLQTEFVKSRRGQFVRTLALLGGTVMIKRQQLIDQEIGPDSIIAMVRQQHKAVDKEIRSTLTSLFKGQPSDSSLDGIVIDEYRRLFEMIKA